MSEIESRYHQPDEIWPLMSSIRSHAELLVVGQADLFDNVVTLMGSSIAEGIQDSVFDERDVYTLRAIYRHGAFCLKMREADPSSAGLRQSMTFRLGEAATSTAIKLFDSPTKRDENRRGRPHHFMLGRQIEAGQMTLFSVE